MATKEGNKRYYAKHRDRIREQRKKNYLAHKEYYDQRASERYHDNIDRERAKGRERNRLAREKAIGHYGKICACCGEADIRFLTIDHINGGGTKHRKKESIHHLDQWLIKNNFPDGFQVLCFNCNQAKAIYGKCPHTEFDIRGLITKKEITHA